MFIGEMGCWILVGLISLYDAWVERQKHGQGYERVTTTDNSEVIAGEEDVDIGEPETRPIHRRRSSVKAMNANHPQHPELNGIRVFLLALPASTFPLLVIFSGIAFENLTRLYSLRYL